MSKSAQRMKNINSLNKKNRRRRKRARFSLAKSGPYLAAFLIPVIIMVIVFIERGIWPFGEQCFLRTDLYHQYAPFFQELKYKMSHGGSLMYTWQIGSGTSFIPIIAYYLSSPANLFLYLCPAKYIIEFITALIVIKLGLCSVSVTWYLNKKHENEGMAQWPPVLFGIFYALSGYMAAYNWNVMWLDCIWLFPIVIFGVEKMFKENRGLLYCISLGFTILTNYYIAIMVSMGVFFYCFFLLATEREMQKNFWLKFAKFLAFTLLAVAFSSVLLIPYIAYFPMTASASGSFNWKDSLRSYFAVFDMVSRHLMNVEVHTGLDHWPNIYCGVFVFLLVPFYYLNKRITLREKLGYTALLLFYYFSFSTRFMDYIWHGLHIPNSLPCRQSFIYIFILLVVSYRGFTGIRDRSYRDITFVLIAALLFVFAAEKLETDATYYSFHVFYLSALFIGLYTIIIYVYRRGKAHTDILLVAVLTLAAIEACINTSVTSVPTVRRSDYVMYDEGVDEIMEMIDQELGEKAFYRTEKLSNRTKNDGAWLGYKTISTFSSTANANLTAFYTKLGLESSTNAYGSTGQTPFTNMLMNVRYSIATTPLEKVGSWRQLYAEADPVYFYENKYTLPLGFMLGYSVIPSWANAAITPLENQNQLAGLVSGVYNLFENVTPEYNAASYVTLTVTEPGFYYIYTPVSGPKAITVTHGTFNKKFDNLNRGYTMDIGYVEAGEMITLINSEDNSVKLIEPALYLFHEEYMNTVYSAFARCPMIVDSYDDTHIKAHIDAMEGGTLMTTIPYEKGWTVKVDGQEAVALNIKEAYLGVDLSMGSHELEFSYQTPWLIPGLLITVLSALLMIAIAVLGRLFYLRKVSTYEQLMDSDMEKTQTK